MALKREYYFLKSLRIIEKLKSFGLNTTYIQENDIEEDEEFLNKTFVVTGTLSSLSRDEAHQNIESRGGKTSSSVSKKTDVVVVGENPGSKYDKALSLGITIWQEEEFIDKLKKD